MRICRRVGFRFLLIVLLALSTVRAQADVGEWTGGGPEGGSLTAVSFNPQVAAGLYILSHSQGVYESTDGATNWSARRDGLQATRRAMVVSSDGTIYIATTEAEVLKSTDGGSSWSDVSPPPVGGFFSRVDLAVDPQNSLVVYLGTYFGDLYRTTDGGASWTLLTTGLPPSPLRIESITIDPNDPLTVYVPIRIEGIYKSTDGGDTWALLSGFTDSLNSDAELAVAPGDSSALYVASGYAVHHSTDGGATWSEILSEPVEQIAIAPSDASVILTSVRYAPSAFWRSSDGGATWSATPVAMGIEDIAIHGTFSNVAVAASSTGPQRTLDSGVTWTSSVLGLDAFGSYLHTSDPLNPDLIHTPDAVGVRSTQDGGATWITQASDLALYDIQMAAGAPSTLYGTQFNEIQLSLDGGATWSPRIADPSDFGDFGPEVAGIQVHPSDPMRLLMGSGRYTFGFAIPNPLVLESIDGGANWSALYEPPVAGNDQYYSYDIEYAPSDPQRIFAAVWNIPEAASWFASVAVSDDGGATWDETLVLPDGILLENSIAVDPNDEDRAWVATIQPHGLHRTTDGGQTWTDITGGLDCYWFIEHDPFDTDTLYTGCDGVYRSTDGGLTWEQVGAESFPENYWSVWTKTVSSTYPRTLNVGTGRGVYSYTFPIEASLTGTCPGAATISVTSATPNSPVAIVVGSVEGSFTVPGGACAGLDLDIADPSIVTTVNTDAQGEADLPVNLPGSVCGQFVQPVDVSTCVASDLVPIPE